MAYTLAAFIAGPEAAAVLAEALDARPVGLEQGLQLVPLRPARSRGGAGAPSSFGAALWWLTADAEQAATRAAGRGVVVYVEAEYFGGVGEQRAVLWQDGHVRVVESELPGAVNEALAAVGARRLTSPDGTLQDEFDSVGLGRRRSTQEWLGSD